MFCLAPGFHFQLELHCVHVPFSPIYVCTCDYIQHMADRWVICRKNMNCPIIVSDRLRTTYYVCKSEVSLFLPPLKATVLWFCGKVESPRGRGNFLN